MGQIIVFFIFSGKIRNGYLYFTFISSAISFSSSPLMWSDIDSPLFFDFLFRKENVLSLSRTLRLFGFGSDVVLMGSPPIAWDLINLTWQLGRSSGAVRGIPIDPCPACHGGGLSVTPCSLWLSSGGSQMFPCQIKLSVNSASCHKLFLTIP